MLIHINLPFSIFFSHLVIVYSHLLCVHRCLSSEKSHEPDTSPMETQPDTSPVETRKSLDISEKTNSGCSAEAVYSGNFSVTVADEGETALVVSIVKGDESHMEPSDTNPLPVEAKMDGDPDSSHLKILCREENTEQVPVKSELKQSLPHDISSRLSSDSYQPFFAADMENRAGILIDLTLSCNFLKRMDSQYALSFSSAK